MRWYWVRLIGLCFFVVLPAIVQAADSDAPADGVAVISAFTEEANSTAEEVRATEAERHQIMFIMGVILLVSLLVTAGLGISMVIFGKEVFVAHMIAAGVSVFLALAHSVTAVVWFYPF